MGEDRDILKGFTEEQIEAIKESWEAPAGQMCRHYEAGDDLETLCVACLRLDRTAIYGAYEESGGPF